MMAARTSLMSSTSTSMKAATSKSSAWSRRSIAASSSIPIGVEQQTEGGIIWGISSALKGCITFKNGAAQQSTYSDFGVARMKDAPVIEVHLVGTDAREPSGIGEPPVPPSVPAIVNAIFAATGKRIRKLPITPNDLA